MAEKSRRWSPYVYAFNNPIRFIDRDGNWPTPLMVDNGKFISSFKMRKHPITGKMTPHKGTDIAAKVGSKVRAAADGKVTKISYQYNTTKKTGWGWYVEIIHKDGYVSRYAHLTEGGIDVKVDQEVKNGDEIAQSGKSGGVTGPHLHSEILENGIQIDPMKVYDLQSFLNLPINQGDLDEVVVNPPQRKDPKILEAGGEKDTTTNRVNDENPPNQQRETEHEENEKKNK